MSIGYTNSPAGRWAMKRPTTRTSSPAPIIALTNLQDGDLTDEDVIDVVVNTLALDAHWPTPKGCAVAWSNYEVRK